MDYLINTPKITFNEDERVFYVLPGYYHMEMSLTSKEDVTCPNCAYANLDLDFSFYDVIERKKQVYNIRAIGINLNDILFFNSSMKSRLIRIKNKSKITIKLTYRDLKSVDCISTLILRPFNTPIESKSY